MIVPRGVTAAAMEVEGVCRQQGWKFCIIGGLAVQRWGTPRFTQDVDITLLTGFGREEVFIQLLLLAFSPRRPDARAFAIEHRVLLARTAGGVDVDIALAAYPFEERMIDRASAWPLGQGAAITTCSPEDLVVMKAFAGRTRDWVDIEGVLIRQGTRLNMAQVRQDLAPLLEIKEDVISAEKLDRLVATVHERLGPQA